MGKMTLKMFVHAKPADSWMYGHTNVIDGFAYNIYGFKTENCAGSATVTIELDNAFDPRLAAVQALKEEREKLRAEFQNRITDIEAQINRFTALEAA